MNELNQMKEMISRAKDAEYVVIADQPMSEAVLAGLEKIELWLLHLPDLIIFL